MTLAEKTFPATTDTQPAEKLWTLEEWDRLVEIGLLDGQRLELIEGRIIQMSPQRAPHSAAIELVEEQLRRVYAKRYRIRPQLPFRTADGSEPEPDFAIIAGVDRRAKQHPSAAVLIVEISDTTLRHDRYKARLYAMTAIPEYWIINLVGRNVEVHRDPRVSKRAPGYQTVKTLNQHDRILPLGMKIDIAVADLLP
jgi:Uma2 family endonuclease